MKIEEDTFLILPNTIFFIFKQNVLTNVYATPSNKIKSIVFNDNQEKKDFINKNKDIFYIISLSYIDNPNTLLNTYFIIYKTSKQKKDISLFNDYNSYIQKYYKSEQKNITKKISTIIKDEFDVYFNLKYRQEENNFLCSPIIYKVFKDLLLINSLKTIFCGICLDLNNDFTLRENYNGDDIKDNSFKFVRPFLFYNVKLNKSKEELLKFEKLFYNKKYLTYFNEENINQFINNISLPSKEEIYNIKKNNILYIFYDELNNKIIKITFNLDDDKKLVGYMNSKDKQNIQKLYNTSEYIKNNFIFDNLNDIIEYKITGKFFFEDETIQNNLSENMFITFLNLTSLTNDKLIIKENNYSIFENKNTINYFILENNDFLINFKEKFLLNKQDEINYSEVYKSKIKSFISSVSLNSSLSDSTADENFIDEKIFNKLSKKNLKSYISNENLDESLNTISIIKFSSEIKNGKTSRFIKYFTTNTEEVIKLKYNLELIISNFYNNFEKVLFKDYNMENIFKQENQIIFNNNNILRVPTNYKKISVIKNNVKEYVIEKNIKKENVDKKDFLIFSNKCQCPNQPIILFNKKEKEDWIKSPYLGNINNILEIDNIGFTCLNKELFPTFDKNNKNLCCRKKIKENVEEKNISSTLKKNIFSKLSKNNYGEINDEFKNLLYFIFSDKKDFLRKGVEKENLEELSIDGNIFIFRTPQEKQEFSTTETSLIFPYTYKLKSSSKKLYLLVFNENTYELIVSKKDGEDYFKIEENDGILKKLEELFNLYFSEFNVDIEKNIITQEKIIENVNIDENENIEESFYYKDVIVQMLIYQYLVEIFTDNTFSLKKWVKEIVKETNNEILFIDQALNFINYFYITLYFDKNNSFNYFPPKQNTIYILKNYKDYFLNILDIFHKKFFCFYNEYVKKDMKLTNESRKIIIPISLKGFLKDVFIPSTLKKNIYDSIVEINSFRNTIEHLDYKKNINNIVYISDNVNYFLNNSYKKYNLWYNNENVNSENLAYSLDLFENNGIVVFFKEKNFFIRLFHPSLIKTCDFGVLNIYELSCFNDSLKCIYKKTFQNNIDKEINYLFAPYNLQKLNIEKIFINSFKDFYNHFILKNKLIFIPFVYLNYY